MRLRLTLLFAVAVALVSVAGVGVTYALLARQLQADIDGDLVEELRLYAGAVASAESTSALLEATRGYLSGPASRSLRERGIILALRTVDGGVVSNSGDLHLEELAAGAALFARGERVLATTDTPAGPYRLAGTPVVLGTRRLGAVEVAAPLVALRSTLRSVLVALVVGASAGTLGAALGAWVIVGRALDPVRRMTRTAASISREDLARRVPYSGPADELGELAQTLNAMLDRLEEAFAAQERFISDVSHELRTPLTIVKGHLQVLDRQDTPDPELIRQEHALVIDELDRLNRLVADLLTLARASRVDFLRPEPVEVDALLHALVAQGGHLGDRHWVVDELPGGSVRADHDRLIQVFLNLMQNAVSHTAPGQTIALGGRRDPGWLRLWVRDEGEGMPPEVRDRVFERFFRGPDADGAEARAGLGLAIVRAIVTAHGGTVAVESEPRRGARFIISLPE
ncbi:MAG: ATP-binding protein [Thermoleophilia bacterium]